MLERMTPLLSSSPIKRVAVVFFIIFFEAHAGQQDAQCFECIYPVESDHISGEEADSLFAQFRINCDALSPATSLDWTTGGGSSVLIPINDTVNEHIEIQTRVRFRGVQLWILKLARADGSTEYLNRTFHFLVLYSPRIDLSFPSEAGFIFKRGVPPFIVAEVNEEENTTDFYGNPFYFLDIIIEGPKHVNINSAPKNIGESSMKTTQRYPPYLTPMPKVTMLFLDGVREEDNAVSGNYSLHIQLLDGSGHSVGSVRRNIHIDFALDYTPSESQRNVPACANAASNCSAASSCSSLHDGHLNCSSANFSSEPCKVRHTPPRYWAAV